MIGRQILLRPAPTVRHRTVLFVGTTTIVAAVLRLWGLADKSLWIDEAFSLWISSQDLGAIWRYTVELDKHPPLYYVLLHFWLGAWQGPEGADVALRSFSALFGVATVPLVYLVGRDAGGRRAGLLAAALMAVSPLQVWYGQLGRMYTMLTFFAALATWCLVRLLTAGRTLDRRAVALCWAGFACATTLTMLSHNTAVLFPVAVGAFLAVPALRTRRTPHQDTGRHPTGHYVVALLVGVLAWLPWLPAFLHQANAVDADFWLPAPTFEHVLEHVGNLVSARAPGELVAGLAVAAVVLVGFGMRRLRGPSGVAVLLLALVIVPVLGELAVSIRRPIFYSQTLVWTAVPFVVLVAAGLRQLRDGRLVAAATGVLLMVNVVSLVAYYPDPGPEDWRGAARHIAANAAPGDVVVFNAAWARIPFDFYYRAEGGPPLDEHGVPTELFERGELEPKVSAADVPRLDALVAGRSRVWVVYSHDWYTDPNGVVANHLGASLVRTGRTELRSIRIDDYSGR